MPVQLPFDLGHRSAFAREDFWVSDSNRDAVAWIDKWPAWPAPALVIYGAEGCGKSHLLQVWQKESGAVSFENSAGAVAVVMDDVDTLIGNPAAEEKIFHLYNSLKEKSGHMLLTAKAPQKSWRFTLPDLRSRLTAAPAVALGSPDDQLMSVVLTKLFSDRQVAVGQDVVQFVLPRIDRSFAALRALVDAVDRKALSEKRAVTIPLVRDLLQAQEKLV